jgi:hypothetical protein
VVYEDDWRRRAAWGTPILDQWRAVVSSSAEHIVPDIAGAPARTAPRLVAFRDWLVEQMQREPGRQFINASGAGILWGGKIEQETPDRLASRLGPPQRDLHGLIRERYHASDGTRVVDAARALVTNLANQSPDSEALLAAWTAFAPGLTRDQIVDAIRAGVDAAEGATPSPLTFVPGAAQYADVFIEQDALRVLATAIPFAALPMAADQIEPHGDGWAFVFQTTAASLVGSTLVATEGGVSEDGRPLNRLPVGLTLARGTYAIGRGRVWFRPSDDADPRTSGRAYVALVPACVESLERSSR